MCIDGTLQARSACHAPCTLFGHVALCAVRCGALALRLHALTVHHRLMLQHGHDVLGLERVGGLDRHHLLTALMRQPAGQGGIGSRMCVRRPQHSHPPCWHASKQEVKSVSCHHWRVCRQASSTWDIGRKRSCYICVLRREHCNVTMQLLVIPGCRHRAPGREHVARQAVAHNPHILDGLVRDDGQGGELRAGITAQCSRCHAQPAACTAIIIIIISCAGTILQGSRAAAGGSAGRGAAPSAGHPAAATATATGRPGRCDSAGQVWEPATVQLHAIEGLLAYPSSL